MKLRKILFTVFVFLLFGAGIAVTAFWPSASDETAGHYQTRVITPVFDGGSGPDFFAEERIPFENNNNLRVRLEEGEFVIAILNHDYHSYVVQDQVVVFRSSAETENPVSLTYIAFDERLRAYRRLWNTPVAATMPATISLFTIDLLGDRSVCIIVTGMNADGEHTLNAFRLIPGEEETRGFEKIADIRIDGSITILETVRSLAYRQNIARGQPFSISAYGRDPYSTNIMDRIEVIYSFNPDSGIFERTRLTRVPGSQIEQRLIREILTGEPDGFENFIYDLWYLVNPDGTLDRSQYLFFDPSRREIIFFRDNTQQIFSWEHSASTRQGLHIISRNISLRTMRRFLNVELVSSDNIRLRVTQDVRMRIQVGPGWDGLYRRVHSPGRTMPGGNAVAVQSLSEDIFDSPAGRISFFPDGNYEIVSGGQTFRGRYVFFRANDNNLLEIRPEPGYPSPFEVHLASAGNNNSRLVFQVTSSDGGENIGSGLPAGNITLSRVRLGVSGIQDLRESRISLIRVTDS